MRTLIGLLLLVVATHSHATTYPSVTITEVENNLGGTYIVSIGPNPTSVQWFMTAFAVTNNDATAAVIHRAGWSGTLLQESEWDSGVTFSLFGPFGEEFPVFTTGDSGVGSFDNTLGLAFHQAVVFWTEEHFALGQGQNTTSGDYGWEDGPASSNAFVLLEGNGMRQFLSCEVGGECVAAAVVPVPAALWLFGPAIGLLAVRARRR